MTICQLKSYFGWQNVCANESIMEIQGSNEEVREFLLHEQDGLYELRVSPLYLDDERLGTLPCFHLTLEDDSNKLWERY
jgi:hypothetical protein